MSDDTVRRRRASGDFRLPMRAVEAIAWFTPEGERTWVPGWDPSWPADRSERPGTVFTTTDGEGTGTIWTVLGIDRDDAVARYGRVTPGRHAGTVQVACMDTGVDCLVTVRYDLTALPGAPVDVLAPYADAPFATMLEQWRTAVADCARATPA